MPRYHAAHSAKRGILLCDQYEISYNLFSKLVPRRYISGPQYLLWLLLFAIHCQVLSQSIPSFPLTYCPCILFCFHSFSVSFTSFTLGPQPLRCWLHCYLQLSWVILLYYFSHTNSSCFLLSSRSSHNWSGLFLPSFWVRMFWQHHFQGVAPYSLSWFLQLPLSSVHLST